MAKHYRFQPLLEEAGEVRRIDLQNSLAWVSVACSTQQGSEMRTADPYPCIHKPPVLRYWHEINHARLDKRSYRAIQLQNYMKILLISDPVTEKSAAAVDVNVGSLSDPVELPGLAHFCEHMLFMGSTKYPDTSEFLNFVSRRGGRYNGSTSSDHTVYFFEIPPEHMRGALDRFAQFFISPLFNGDCTARKINAVHLEFQKNYGNDSWRLDQLDKHTAKPGHPYSKFFNGNRESLMNTPRDKGIDVREELKKFHSKWYSSNIMTAAVLAKEDLDQLEKMVVAAFSKILNKNALHLEWREHPFGPEQCKVSGYVVPLDNTRTLRISFPSPDYEKHYRTKPFHYISSLLNHEGPGGLLSALRRRGWCDHLTSGGRIGGKGFGFFSVKMTLTEEGLEHVNDVVKLFFQYVHMLQSKGPQKWFFDESRNILHGNFRFKDKEKPYSYVTALAKNLHLYPADQVLQAPYILDKWNPEIIKQFTDLIAPSNVRLAVVSQKFDSVTDQVEPWFHTKYKLEDIPDHVTQDWENCGLCPEFEFPPPNEFVPASYALVPREEENPPHPVLLKETSRTRLWYMLDDEFSVPRANFYVEFFSPLAYIDPFNFNLASIYVLLVQDALTDCTRTANSAGITWDMKSTEYGITLTIGGYDEKQSILFDRVLGTMVNLQVDPERFEKMKETYLRSLAAFDAKPPCEQTTHYLSALISDHLWMTDELQRATDGLTAKRLEEFVPQLLSKLFVECLAHGNITRERALDLVSILERRFEESSLCVRPLLPVQLIRRREIQLSDGANYVYEVTNPRTKSSCTELYYQCDVQSIKDNLLMDLIAQLMVGPAEEILRNKEQLGNKVVSGIRRSNSVQGLRFVVQSQKHPLYLDQRVEAFIIKLRQILVDVKQADFKSCKLSLLRALLEKPKTLTALTQKYWREINLRQYHFNRAAEEVDCLKEIYKDDMLRFFDTYIKYGAPNRRKLSVHILSQAEGGAGQLPAPDECTLNSNGSGSSKPPPFVQPRKIRDISRFKTAHGYFPFPEPFADIDAFRVPDANLQ